MIQKLKDLVLSSKSLRRIMSGIGQRALPLVFLLVAVSLLSVFIPVGDTLWSKVLGFRGTIKMATSTPTPEEPGEGCSLGFWKQEHHFSSWPEGYSPEDLFEDIFLINDFGNRLTLLDALKMKGGGLNALLRQATAAFLNAAHPAINYGFGMEEVISMFQAAFAASEYEDTKNVLEQANEAGCPLGDSEEPPEELGTTIEAEKTAVGYWIDEDDDDDIDDDKKCDDDDDGDDDEKCDDDNEIVVVQGEICVTNTGEEATENLTIVDQLQFKTEGKKFKDLKGASLKIVPDDQLDPGKTQCYPYEITFEIDDDDIIFRNHALITITNHVENPGEAYGVEVWAEFELPKDDESDEKEEPKLEVAEPPSPTPIPVTSETPTPTETETPTSTPTTTFTTIPTETPTVTNTPTETLTETQSPAP
jgi:hypothetical protein